jgi:hypothetical protein
LLCNPDALRNRDASPSVSLKIEEMIDFPVLNDLLMSGLSITVLDSGN